MNSEYKILKELDSQRVLIQCNTCKNIFSYYKTNLYKFHHSSNKGNCIATLHRKIEAQYGKEFEEKFFQTANGAKNRVLNPNNKDYYAYKDLGFGFRDNFEFAELELEKFAEAAKTYGLKNISIDRIDGSKGYYHDNIRYVPMDINLRNKSICKEILCKNLNTGEISIYENAYRCGDVLNINPSRIRDCCVRENHYYKNLYSFEYLKV